MKYITFQYIYFNRTDSLSIKYHIYVFRYFIMKNNFKNKILKIFILIKLLGTLCDNMIKKINFDVKLN